MVDQRIQPTYVAPYDAVRYLGAARKEAGAAFAHAFAARIVPSEVHGCYELDDQFTNIFALHDWLIHPDRLQPAISAPTSVMELRLFFESWGLTLHGSISQSIAYRMQDDAEVAFGSRFQELASIVLDATRDSYYLRGGVTWEGLFELWMERQQRGNRREA